MLSTTIGGFKHPPILRRSYDVSGPLKVVGSGRSSRNHTPNISDNVFVMSRTQDWTVIGHDLTHLFTLQSDTSLSALMVASDKLGDSVKRQKGNKSKSPWEHGLRGVGTTGDNFGNIETIFCIASFPPLSVAGDGSILGSTWIRGSADKWQQKVPQRGRWIQSEVYQRGGQRREYHGS